MALTLTEPDGWAYYSRMPLVYTASESNGLVRTIKWTINLRRTQTGASYETITVSTQVNNQDKVHLDVAAVMRGSVKDDGLAHGPLQTEEYPSVGYPKSMSKSGIYWLNMTVVSQDVDGGTISTVSSTTDRMIMDGYSTEALALNYKDTRLNITDSDSYGWLTDRDMSGTLYTMHRTKDTLPSLALIRLREYDDDDPDNPNILVSAKTADGNSSFYMTDADIDWGDNAYQNRQIYSPNPDDSAIFAEKTSGAYQIGDEWSQITTYSYMSDSRKTTTIKILNIGCHNSKTKPVHLKWQNSKGGVDDVVFEGHHEVTQNVKEKRYQVSRYTTFGNTPELNTSGATVRYYAEAEKTIKCSSVALTADDRRILQYAYKSPRVWYRVVDDYSNWEPCTLQGSYTFETAKSRLREVSITLKPTKEIVC